MQELIVYIEMRLLKTLLLYVGHGGDRYFLSRSWQKKPNHFPRNHSEKQNYNK